MAGNAYGFTSSSLRALYVYLAPKMMTTSVSRMGNKVGVGVTFSCHMMSISAIFNSYEMYAFRAIFEKCTFGYLRPLCAEFAVYRGRTSQYRLQQPSVC